MKSTGTRQFPVCFGEDCRKKTYFLLLTVVGGKYAIYYIDRFFMRMKVEYENK